VYVHEKDLRKGWLPDPVFNKLWACYHISHDPHVLENLVSGSLPLVEYVIRRSVYQNMATMDKEDIEAYGIIGLLEAIQRYDPKKNPNFTRYAAIRIQGAVYDGVLRFRGLSRNYLRKRKWVMKQMKEVQQVLERDLTQQEMYEILGMESAECRKYWSEEQSLQMLSLDTLENKEYYLKDMQTPEYYMDEDEREELLYVALENAILKLPPLQQTIIQMHYYQKIALREIARRTGYSHSWIIKVHKAAVETLKSMKIDDIPDK